MMRLQKQQHKTNHQINQTTHLQLIKLKKVLLKTKLLLVIVIVIKITTTVHRVNQPDQYKMQIKRNKKMLQEVMQVI